MSDGPHSQSVPAPQDLSLANPEQSAEGVPLGSHSALLGRAVTSYAATHGPDLHAFVGLAERLLITYALDRARGVKLRAAQSLGINRVTLDRKIAEHGLNVVRGKGVLISQRFNDS